MSTRRRLIMYIVVLVAVVAAFSLRRHGATAPVFAAETVRHGEVIETLREIGTLVPRDPTLVKCRFSARLQFIVEDGTWVEPGANLFVLGDDDEIQKVSEDRSQLLGTRQELQLARMKRAHAGEVEDAKLAAVMRAAALEEIRFRILTAKPIGGMELVRIDDELRPIEALTAKLRATYETCQDAYQAAVDAYLEALDRTQDQREAEDRLQARVDELNAAASLDPDGLNAAQRADREQAAKDLVGVQGELAKLTAAGAGLDQALVTARAVRDAAKAPRDAAQADLAGREAREEDLSIRIEIEKRGLVLAQLRLDHESAQLQLAEAQRKRQQGEAAAKAGAISAAELEDLRGAESSAGDQLAIIDEKVAIAERPPAPELLEEGRMKLERARAKAAAAQEDHDRALAIADQEVELLIAKERRLAVAIEGRSRWFPSLIEANIEFAERELSALERDGDAAPGDVARRGELVKDLERMRQQLDAAKADAPGTVQSTMSGIVKVRGNGNRPIQAGDQVNEDDVLIEIHPPGNMQVLVKVNEVNVARLRVGMPVAVEITSLPGVFLAGAVEQLAGVGKDKYADFNGRADVTEFDARISLDQARADLRQGMSALVAVRVDRLADALWLPLSALRRSGAGWTALVGDARTARPVQGHPFGEDRFIIEGGLVEGETVWVPILAEQK